MSESRTALFGPAKLHMFVVMIKLCDDACLICSLSKLHLSVISEKNEHAQWFLLKNMMIFVFHNI